jgi:AsmA protein
VSAALVSDSLNAAFAGSPSRHWETPDAAAFRALPWPNVQFYGARLNQSGADLLSAPEARIDLSLGDLLRGRLVPVRASLTRPIVTIDLQGRPFGSAELLTGVLNAKIAITPLASVSLSNGVIRVVDARHGLDTELDDVEGQIDGLGLGNPLRLHLSMVWRQTPIIASGSLTGFESTIEGKSAGLIVALASPVANLGFNGTLGVGGAPSLTGDLAFSSPEFGALARLFELQAPAYVPAKDVAVSAKLKGSRADLTLDDATISAAGQTLRGALRVADFRGRATVSGTLDADKLELGALLGPPSALVETNGDWRHRRFALRPPQAFDLDLRLSVGTLGLFGGALSNAAGSVMVKDGQLTASLIEASAYGAKIEGEARLASGDDGLDIHARTRLTDMDFGAALADLGWAGLTGRGALDVSLASSGSTPAASLDRLNGVIALRIEDGALEGVNLEEALRRSQRHPVDIPRDLRAGRTAFDRIRLDLLVGQGVAHVAAGELVARGIHATLAGAISLPELGFNLHVNAMQTDTAGEAQADGAHLDFDIDGPWPSPAMRASSVDEPDTR